MRYVVKSTVRSQTAPPGQRIGWRGWVDPDGQKLHPKIKVIQTPEECEWLERRLMAETVNPVSFDTEFRGCDLDVEHPFGLARATSAQFTFRDGVTAYLDNWGPCEGNIDVARKWAHSADHPKLAHYYPIDAHCLWNHYGEEPIRGLHADTLCLDWLRDTSREGRHGLKEAAQDWLGFETHEYRETFARPKQLKKGGDSKVLELVPHYQWWDEGWRVKVANYACSDPMYTFGLYDAHKAALEQVEWAGSRSYWDYYLELERPFAEVLLHMERRGMLVDLDYTAQLNEMYQEEATYQGRQFYRWLVEEQGVPVSFLEGSPPKFADRFNANSPQQLGRLIFDVLGMERVKETPDSIKKRRKDPTREPTWSTDKEVLEYLAGMNPGLRHFMEERHLRKLAGTYTEMMLTQAPRWGGYIHTSFRQLTRTGRLSSSHPNFQNVPIRSAMGKLVRRCFIAPKGRKVWDADYDQIEIRVAAHESGDPVMVKNCIEEIDAHSQTAYFIDEDVRAWVDANGGPTKGVLALVKKMFEDSRDLSKRTNFAVQYGAGEMKVASLWGVDKATGKVYIDRYFNGYPGLKRYMDNRERFAKTNRYVRTLLGRYLHFPQGDDSMSFGALKREARQAGNWPIQGGARDVLMLAMLALETDRGGKAHEYMVRHDIRLRAQIHDELVWYGPDGLFAEARKVIEPVMSDPYHLFGFKKLIVPTNASMGEGDNWGTAH